MLYDDLIKAAEQHGIDICEKPLVSTIKGLYADGCIWINRNIPTRAEKACILAEELGHYHTSVGDMIDLSDIRNRKQERRARAWAYEEVVPLSKIVQAHYDHVTHRYDLAEYLGVTEPFLQAALDRYRERYGTYTVIDNHIIYFDPLGVAKMFE
jgi:hypothetical protein